MTAIATGENHPWALSCSIQVSNRTRCCGQCQFCISRTTPGCADQESGIIRCDESRLRVGLNYAKTLGATHAILTSKADPTQEDPKYLIGLVKTAREYVPLVDMHTNGLLLQQGKRLSNSDKFGLLRKLADAGLTMVTFSIASFDEAENRDLMGIPQNPQYLIEQALSLGLLVRCSLATNKKYMGNVNQIMNYINHAGDLGVHMVVIRELWIPENFNDPKNSVLIWNRENKVDIAPIQKRFVDATRSECNISDLKQRDPLPWGTPVFVIDGKFTNPDHGVNITFARCDEASTGRIMKSIVHKPDGHGYRNWDSNGDILY